MFYIHVNLWLSSFMNSFMPLDTMTRMKRQASNDWAIQFQYNGLFITLLWVFPKFLPHLLATSQVPHCSSARVLPSSSPTVPRAPAVPRARVGRARGQAAKWEVRCPSGGTKNHNDVQYILCMYLYTSTIIIGCYCLPACASNFTIMDFQWV